ncbi:hypothetical protein D3C81_1648780 [compost metagenome]
MGTPISSAGTSVPNRIVRCCNSASLKISWRLAYSLSRERVFSSPLNSSASGRTQICAWSSQRQSGCCVRRRIASLQASRHRAIHSHNPLPAEVRASGVSAVARCVAACPALQVSSTTNASQRISVKMSGKRPRQNASTAASRRDRASRRGENAHTCQTDSPSPDTSRLGAKFTNGSAHAASATNASSSSTRL